MPQPKVPKPLRTMCINFMVDIIIKLKLIKTAGFGDDIIRAMTSSAEETFSILPVSIVDDVLQLYGSQYPNGIDGYFPLEVFIDCRTTRLSLHFPDFMQTSPDSEVLLKKIGSVGPSIIDLKLSGSILKNIDCFVHYTLGHLRNITHLALLYLRLDDAIPITVGKCCIFIEDITLTGWGITDVGITCLVPKVSQTLKRLKLEYDKYQMPNITKYAVVHILRNAPRLEGITIPHLKEALEMLMDEDTISVTPLALSVCDFYEQPHSLEPFSSHFSSGLSVLCPHITDISLVVSEPNALLPLSELKCLTTLRLSAQNVFSENYILIFSSCISKLLSSIGHNIRCLELNAPELDLTVIDMYCPTLYKLECTDFQIVRRSLQPKEEAFKHLKSLKIFASNEHCLLSHDLFHLLSCCNTLELLYISNCDSFSDEILKKILQSNPLRNVSLIEFTDLCAITMHSLMNLVLDNSKLMQLHIFSCDAVSENDVEALRNAVIQFNFDLNIKFNRLL